MGNKEALKKDFDYYLEHKQTFVKDEKYYGKYVVIKNENIIGAYDTENQAIDDMLKKNYKLGEFIVQIVRENDGTSVSCVSNVYV